jgi:hypothetical protein
LIYSPFVVFNSDKYKFMKPFSLVLLFQILIMSCSYISKPIRESYLHELYIDYRYISYQGKNSTQTLYMEIDSTQGIWYYGKLVIGQNDTFNIRGFEKGSHYVTMYSKSGGELSGDLEIYCRGEVGKIRDSLTIQERDEVQGIIKEKTVLYRRPRMN